MAARWEIDKKSKAKGHQDSSKPDSRKILARFLDENADYRRSERKSEHKREEVDTGKNWSCAKNGLEVEGEEKGARNKDHAMTEADQQCADIGAVLEDAQRYDGVFREFPFVYEENSNRDEPKHDKADDRGGIPRVGNSAIFEAEEEHDCPTHDCDTSNPINRLQPGQ